MELEKQSLEERKRKHGELLFTDFNYKPEIRSLRCKGCNQPLAGRGHENLCSKCVGRSSQAYVYYSDMLDYFLGDTTDSVTIEEYKQRKTTEDTCSG